MDVRKPTNPMFLLPPLRITVTAHGVGNPLFLWSGKPLDRHIDYKANADQADILLSTETFSPIDMANPRSSQGDLSGYRLIDRDRNAHLELFPSVGASLHAQPEYFYPENHDLHYLFGLAVSHAFARLGASVIHAAGFQIKGMCILALGPSRSGKSTLTALALRSGARVCSDDTLLLRASQDGQAYLEMLKPNLLFRHPTTKLLPNLIRNNLQPLMIRDEQRLNFELSSSKYSLNEIYPTVLLVSRIDKEAEKTRVERINKTTAMAEVMRSVSSLFLTDRFGEERAAMRSSIECLALGVPGFKVHLGQDTFAQPDLAFKYILNTIS
jgi:hypothetical protein